MCVYIFLNQGVLHIFASVTKPVYNISPLKYEIKKKTENQKNKINKHEVNKIIFSYHCENH